VRILAVSLGPIFPRDVHGGSQKVLRDLSIGLAKRGNRLTILCTRRDDNHLPFELDEGVVVKPILPFKQVFPMPYAVPPHQLARLCSIILDEIRVNDLLYLHDGGLNIEFLKNIIPTVVSLRDFTYPETLLGAFNFNESDLIVNSEHTYQSLLRTVATFKPDIIERTHIVFNGYDDMHFKPCSNIKRIKSYLNLVLNDDDRIISFPHRGESSKGVFEVLEIVKVLARTCTKFKLLMPRYIDLNVSSDLAPLYDKVERYIRDHDLTSHVILHAWVPHHLMPEYYSLAHVTLCVGNFVEAFSNATIESLLCGTPVVTSKAATYRSMPVMRFIQSVDYQDYSSIIHLILRAFNGDFVNSVADARAAIQKDMRLEVMVTQYETIFARAVNKAPLPVRLPQQIINQDTVFKLSPWCYVAGSKIYDDYISGYHATTTFNDLLVSHGGSLSLNDLQQAGFGMPDALEALKLGVLVAQ